MASNPKGTTEPTGSKISAATSSMPLDSDSQSDNIVSETSVGANSSVANGSSATLIALPNERFANFTESRRKVNRDGHVAIDRAFYSAPPEYVGREVWARWDSRTVRIYSDSFQVIAMFARSEQGKFNTKTQHIATEKINSIERGGAYLLKKVAFIGTASARWSQAMLREKGIAGHRVLQGLIALSSKYRGDQIEQARLKKQAGVASSLDLFFPWVAFGVESAIRRAC